MFGFTRRLPLACLLAQHLMSPNLYLHRSFWNYEINYSSNFVDTLATFFLYLGGVTFLANTLDWIQNEFCLPAWQLKNQMWSNMLLKCSNNLMVQLFGNLVCRNWVGWAMRPAELLTLAKLVRDIHITTNFEIAPTESQGFFHFPKSVKLWGLGQCVKGLFFTPCNENKWVIAKTDEL